jgi:hypothetical protein
MPSSATGVAFVAVAVVVVALGAAGASAFPALAGSMRHDSLPPRAAGDGAMAKFLTTLVNGHCSEALAMLSETGFVWHMRDATTQSGLPWVTVSRSDVAQMCAHPASKMSIDSESMIAHALPNGVSTLMNNFAMPVGPPVNGGSVNCTAYCHDVWIAQTDSKGKITTIYNDWDQAPYYTRLQACNGHPYELPDRNPATADLTQVITRIGHMMSIQQCDSVAALLADNFTFSFNAPGFPPRMNKAEYLKVCKSPIPMTNIANDETATVSGWTVNGMTVTGSNRNVEAAGVGESWCASWFGFSFQSHFSVVKNELVLDELSIVFDLADYDAFLKKCGVKPPSFRF